MNFTHAQILGVKPKRPSLQPLMPMPKIKSSEFFQFSIIAPGTDRPLVRCLHNIGEAGSSDVVLHEFFHHKGSAEHLAKTNG